MPTRGDPKMRRTTAAKPWTERMTVTVPEYGEIVGCSRTTAYESVRAGDVPTIKVGGRTYVPVPALKRKLGVDDKQS